MAGQFESRGERRLGRRIVAVTFAGVTIAGLWACWPREPTVPSVTPKLVDPDPWTPEERDDEDSPLPRFIENELRAMVKAGESTPQTGDVADFDALLEQLVAITVAAHHAAKADDGAKIERLEEPGNAILRRILTHVEDPDNKALFKLTGLPSEDTTLRGTARRHLCLGILRRGLERRLMGFETGGSRDPLDHLVQTMLESIPQDEVVAGDLSKLLTGTRYLGVAHEAPVLDVVALAAEDRYLIPWVTGILQTLWDNLQAEGARTSEELIHLALMFRADANRAKRLVALRHLLVAGGGRYRELVLHEVVSTRDEELCAELTMTVATKLPPQKAITTLERLSMVTTRQLMPAFMTLGEREPRILVEAYERNLADGTRADYRAELVTGAGFGGGSVGLKVARMAFEHDPDPTVRSRAMFALTGQAGAAEGEKILMAALDDPAFAEHPGRLGQVVLALQNLVATGNPNAVDRVGRRLKGMGQLDAEDRRRLEMILERALPKSGGQRRSGK